MIFSNFEKFKPVFIFLFEKMISLSNEDEDNFKLWCKYGIDLCENYQSKQRLIFKLKTKARLLNVYDESVTKMINYINNNLNNKETIDIENAENILELFEWHLDKDNSEYFKLKDFLFTNIILNKNEKFIYDFVCVVDFINTNFKSTMTALINKISSNEVDMTISEFISLYSKKRHTKLYQENNYFKLLLTLIRIIIKKEFLETNTKNGINLMLKHFNFHLDNFTIELMKLLTEKENYLDGYFDEL